jgi:hypothetical protein
MCATYVETRNTYAILIVGRDGQTQLVRPKCRWKDNIKIDIVNMRIWVLMTGSMLIDYLSKASVAQRRRRTADSVVEQRRVFARTVTERWNVGQWWQHLCAVKGSCGCAACGQTKKQSYTPHPVVLGVRKFAVKATDNVREQHSARFQTWLTLACGYSIDGPHHASVATYHFHVRPYYFLFLRPPFVIMSGVVVF